MVLAKAGSVKVTNRIKARVYLLDSDEGGLDEPLCRDNTFKFFCHSCSIMANVNRITWGEDSPSGEDFGGDMGSMDGRQMVMPGEEATMELMTYRKFFLPLGARFTLRTNDLTIGYGVGKLWSVDSDLDQ